MGNKFVRGGCWNSTSNNLPSSLRGGDRPAFGGNTLGFRVVKEVESPDCVRGGSWGSQLRRSLSSRNRVVFSPATNTDYWGFRVVKEIKPPVRGVRGGNWCNDSPRFLWSSGRIVFSPSVVISSIGFRVVKSINSTIKKKVMSIKTIKIEAGKDLKGNLVAEFEMGETAITQAQWCSVMGSLPQAYLDAGGEFDPKKPVTHVSYYDAEEFCKNLSKQTGENYRLPTGQEWEYACRAGTTGDFSCPAEELEDYAVFNQTHIADVATKLPNGNGLYDMHGNVWEWTQD